MALDSVDELGNDEDLVDAEDAELDDEYAAEDQEEEHGDEIEDEDDESDEDEFEDEDEYDDELDGDEIDDDDLDTEEQLTLEADANDAVADVSTEATPEVRENQPEEVAVSEPKKEKGDVRDDSAAPAETPHYRRDIQGLRALAVALVILAHAKVSHFAGGYVGVDVFFVISGFVITGLLLREAQGSVMANLGRFYARRIRRIMPAATVIMLVTLFASFLWLGPFSSQALLTDVRWGSLFSANWHFISVHSDYLSQSAPPSLITHFWSLAVEEQFYLVFPLVLFVVGVIMGLRRHRVALSAVLLAVVVASAIWSALYTWSSPIAAYYSPFTRFWELGLGALVATLPAPTRAKALLGAVGGWLSVAAILSAAFCLNDYSAVPGWLTWWACAPAAFLLWSGGTRSLAAPSGWLSLRPVRYVGDVSYSLYLWHFIWLNLPLQYAQLKFFFPQSGVMGPWTRVGQVAAAFGCAVLSYHLLENPLRRSKWLDRHPVLTIPLAGALVGAVWLAAALFQHLWTI